MFVNIEFWNKLLIRSKRSNYIIVTTYQNTYIFSCAVIVTYHSKMKGIYYFPFLQKSKNLITYNSYPH